MKNKKHKIYLTTNLITNKIYIGRSCGKLKCEGGRYLGSGIVFIEELEKYGESNFSQIIIDVTDYENRSKIEKYWIEFYKSEDPLIGYNQKVKAKSPEQKAIGLKYLCV